MPPRAQGLGQALDPVPAELDAGGHHQHVVAERVAGFGGDAVGHRIEATDGIADPAHPGGDQPLLGAAGLLQAEHPTPHQGPAGLVVVVGRGLEDGDLQARPGPLELAGHREARCPSADDQDLVMGHGGRSEGVAGSCSRHASLPSSHDGGSGVSGALRGSGEVSRSTPMGRQRWTRMGTSRTETGPCSSKFATTPTTPAWWRCWRSRQLFDPFDTQVQARLHGGEELQDPQNYAKVDLFFPSGEALPRCWVDSHYQD